MNSECRRTSRAFGGNGSPRIFVCYANLQVCEYRQEGGCYAPKI